MKAKAEATAPYGAAPCSSDQVQPQLDRDVRHMRHAVATPAIKAHEARAADARQALTKRAPASDKSLSRTPNDVHPLQPRYHCSSCKAANLEDQKVEKSWNVKI